MRKLSQEESCSIEAGMLWTPFGTTRRTARRVLYRLTMSFCESTPMICPTEPFIQFFNAVFHRGEMFIAVDTAFRSRMQSFDIAVVGARAKQHGFDGRQWKELTLTHETWSRQVV